MILLWKQVLTGAALPQSVAQPLSVKRNLTISFQPTILGNRMSFSIPVLSSAKFTAEAELDSSAKKLILRMSGVLDENVKTQQITNYVGKLGSEVRDVWLELQGIASINSSGVRAWIIMIDRLQKNERRCIFSTVSEAFLEKAGPYPTMLGEKTNAIISFEAPYFCPQCKIRSLHVLKASDMADSGFDPQPPSFNCDKCSNPLNFDEVPEDYFSFLSRLSKV